MFVNLNILLCLPNASAQWRLRSWARFCIKQKLETEKKGLMNKQWLQKLCNHRFNNACWDLKWRSKAKLGHEILQELYDVSFFLWERFLGFTKFGSTFSFLRCTLFPALFPLRRALWSSFCKIVRDLRIFLLQSMYPGRSVDCKVVYGFSFERRLLSGKSLSINANITSRSSYFVIWSTFTVEASSQIQSFMEPFESLPRTSIDGSFKHVFDDLGGMCKGVHSPSTQCFSIRLAPGEEQVHFSKGAFRNLSLSE